ncbi:hypothetical protein ACFSHQ_23915 [Gemmobacter lanyuensis]
MSQWRIDAPGQTLVLASSSGVPRVIWWGPTLPASEDLAELARAEASDMTGMLDRLPELTLCPLPSADWQGQPGLVLAEADGRPLSPRLRFQRAETGTGSLQLISGARGCC